MNSWVIYRKQEEKGTGTNMILIYMLFLWKFSFIKVSLFIGFEIVMLKFKYTRSCHCREGFDT